MRKDVKLGFTIGGVLLAVLVVYVLVISSGPPQQQKNEVALVKPQAAPGENAAEPSRSSDAGASKTPDHPVDAATIDPFKPTVSEKAAAQNSKQQQPSATGEDKWSVALNTGKFDPKEQLQTLMVSETPTPAPAEKNGSSSPPVPAAAKGPIQPESGTAAQQQQPRDSAGETIASQVLGASPSTQPAGPARTHVVQRNETFASIAAAVYGNSAYYPHLIRANPNIDPKKLRPGMTINIPDPAEVVASRASSAQDSSSTSSGNRATSLNGPLAASSAATSIDEKTHYRVQASDSLYKISLKLYGRADRIDKLYELNKELIGPDRNRLKTGMVLKLPEPPTNLASAAR